ncbi:MAG: histidine kinase [Bacteroidetes bacterium]|nr:MAG: histidine kinase [Bacteroidota bacterium]
MAWILTLMLSGMAGYARAQAVLTLQDGTTSYALGPYLEVLEDPTGRWSVEAVQADSLHRRFRPLDAASLHPGAAAYWLRFRTRASDSGTSSDPGTSDARAAWLLETLADEVTAYVRDEAGGRVALRTGLTVPLRERPVPVGLPPLLPLTLADTATMVYLRVRHDFGSYASSDRRPAEVLSPVLHAQAPVLEADRTRRFWQGLFFGFMLAMAGYNLFLLLSVRDRSYLYYVLYVLSFTAFFGVSRGYLQEIAWPDAWRALPDGLFLLVPIGSIWYLLFSQAFLQTRRWTPGIHRVLQGLIGLSGIGVVLGLAGYWTPATGLMALVVPSTTLCSMGASVIAMRQGYRPARYFLLACALFIVGVLLYTGAWLQWLPTTALTKYGVQAGAALEALLFSFGLGHRIRTLRREKQAAREHALRAEAETKMLQETSALKTQLLGMAAHDLRNPLTTIQVATRELADELDGSPLGEFAAMADTAAGHMVALLKDLLSLAAIESGRIELRRRPMAMAPLAESVVQAHRPQARLKQQRIELIAAAPEAMVVADQERLREIMDNLVSNAVKYAPPGSAIEVCVEVRGRVVRFAVQDEGPGFSEEDRRHLFEAFRPLSARPTGNEGSTGLGLAITRHLVELHGGHIDVESEPGQGSRVFVDLPRAAVEALQPAASP